jgi:hypothetical protein
VTHSFTPTRSLGAKPTRYSMSVSILLEGELLGAELEERLREQVGTSLGEELGGWLREQLGTTDGTALGDEVGE